MQKRKWMMLARMCTLMVFANILVIPPASADKERGQALYENHCQFCHGETVHQRESNLVESMQVLRAWVRSWSVHEGLNWSMEEVNDVAQYLNAKFYQFSE